MLAVLLNTLAPLLLLLPLLLPLNDDNVEIVAADAVERSGNRFTYASQEQWLLDAVVVVVVVVVVAATADDADDDDDDVVVAFSSSLLVKKCTSREPSIPLPALRSG